ncbi:hypothetical protein [Kordia sp.]|uniref:hypothetical protein n=1 Tax=Kordia sp. TaxID=1965332 RepID=UPI003D6C4612
MQHTQPLLKFSITGGTPPNTSISVFVYNNKEAIILIENGWPIIQNTNEVGTYKYTISQEELQELINNLEKIKGTHTQYGEKQSGSLRYNLSIFNGANSKKIQWEHFAKIPEQLNNLKTSLQELIKNGLHYNYQTIKASFEISASNATISLHNTGKVPVTLLVPTHELLKKRMFLVSQTDRTNNISIPEIYGLATPFGYEFSKNTISIQANETVTFNSTIQTEKTKEYFAIVETQWTTMEFINKKVFPFLFAKAVHN